MIQDDVRVLLQGFRDLGLRGVGSGALSPNAGIFSSRRIPLQEPYYSLLNFHLFLVCRG